MRLWFGADISKLTFHRGVINLLANTVNQGLWMVDLTIVLII